MTVETVWINQWYTLCALWKKLARNSTRILSKKFFSSEQLLSMIPSREIPLHSSRLPSQRYYRTMWHCLASSLSQCRTVRVTSINSLPTRYNHSLLLSLILVCYTYQVQNQTCCSALVNLQKQSHLQHMTAKSWMDPLLFIACQPSMSAPSTYADKVFIPHLERHLQDTKRLDVVWDEFIQNILKESTREKRGKGVQKQVSGSTKIPGNWKNFLGDQMNKKELFAFLTSKIESFSWPPTKSVCVTSGQAVSACGL